MIYSKSWIIFAVLICSFGCNNRQSQKNDELISKRGEHIPKTFKNIKDYPLIKDSASFILELKKLSKIDSLRSQGATEKITFFKKIKLNGSNQDFIFIEYNSGHDYETGVGTEFPWKYQFLFDVQGHLIKSFYGLRFQLVEIFPNQNPFLLILTSTYRGNGGHEIYKISTDTLENVYDGYNEYAIKTYDSYEDSKIYSPNELSLEIKDYNSDGFKDLIFTGKLILIQGVTNNGSLYDTQVKNGKKVEFSAENPFKKIPVRYVFLYDIKGGHFKAKDDYAKIYNLNE
jgi:hypothetical protein